VGGVDGVRALDVVVVDEDGGRLRSAALEDADVVFDATLVGKIDDLVPADIRAGQLG